MPNVITLLETIETEKSLHDQEPAEYKPVLAPVSQSRLSRLLGSLRIRLSSRKQDMLVPNGEQFESGMDMLSQKHPYLFIRALCG